MHKGERVLETLFHPGGVRSYEIGFPREKVDEFQEIFKFPSRLPGAPDAGGEFEILHGGELVIELEIRGHEADVAETFPLGNLPPAFFERDIAARRRKDAGKYFQQRRFS